MIHTLLEKRLVTAAGRKAVVGRPILYRTTKEFLIHFGLKDLSELPTLKEFEEIVNHSSLFAEPSSPATAGTVIPSPALEDPPPALNFADPATESLQAIDESGDEGPAQ